MALQGTSVHTHSLRTSQLHPQHLASSTQQRRPTLARSWSPAPGALPPTPHTAAKPEISTHMTFGSNVIAGVGLDLCLTVSANIEIVTT